MRRTDFHYDLPPDLIAQRPTEERSAGRLLALDGASGVRRDLEFRDLPALLTAQDLLVFNDTRVLPARVHGVKESGGRIELLLERALGPTTALVHARASKGLKAGARVALPGGVMARMLDREGELFRLEFSSPVLPYFEAHGDMPLPPYLNRAPEPADRERYQTVFARNAGAVAAPTAGLHFDAPLFAALEARGVQHAFVTLHVGAGTFQPVREDELALHVMHEEFLEVPESTARSINAAHAAGGRVIAVGTTVVRSLETAAAATAAKLAAGPVGPSGPSRTTVAGTTVPASVRGRLKSYQGATRLFLKPGDKFRIVDGMVTNFHLPESTLLMLCAAFVGRETLLAAYAHAIASRYRFFSYGDAMFLTPQRSATEGG
jgi:S-adenosylmethionine:tRNA ribosyltransferase-isomerase